MSKQYNIVAELIAKSDKFRQGMADASRATKSFMNDFQKGIKDSQKQLNQLGESAKSTFESIKTSAQVAGAAIAGMFGVGIAQGIEYNAMIERATTSYEILLKSQEKANQMVEELNALALKTPFGFEGLDKAAKTMIGMGIAGENVIPIMEILSDAVAGVGGNVDQLEGIALAIAQINAKGKLSAEEVMISRPTWKLVG